MGRTLSEDPSTGSLEGRREGVVVSNFHGATLLWLSTTQRLLLLLAFSSITRNHLVSTCKVQAYVSYRKFCEPSGSLREESWFTDHDF
jgi:hypothetical protein